MKIVSGMVVLIVAVLLAAATTVAQAPAIAPCTEAWYLYLSRHYFEVADDEGHGPEFGSNEWFDAFETLAGLPESNGLPPALRCQVIQQRLDGHPFVINRLLGWAIRL